MPGVTSSKYKIKRPTLFSSTLVRKIAQASLPAQLAKSNAIGHMYFTIVSCTFILFSIGPYGVCSHSVFLSCCCYARVAWLRSRPSVADGACLRQSSKRHMALAQGDCLQNWTRSSCRRKCADTRRKTFPYSHKTHLISFLAWDVIRKIIGERTNTYINTYIYIYAYLICM